MAADSQGQRDVAQRQVQTLQDELTAKLGEIRHLQAEHTLASARLSELTTPPPGWILRTNCRASSCASTATG